MPIAGHKLREKRNRPPADEPWIWFTRELLKSEAWCALSRARLRVVFRVMPEHMAHAGTENGNLVVTYADFEKFGIRREAMRTAISEVSACGLVIVIERGRASVGPDCWPSKYALGWLPASLARLQAARAELDQARQEHDTFKACMSRHDADDCRVLRELEARVARAGGELRWCLREVNAA